VPAARKERNIPPKALDYIHPGILAAQAIHAAVTGKRLVAWGIVDCASKLKPHVS
jgi:hypothetical protein